MRTQRLYLISGPERLAGTLYLPGGRGPWPAAVLVHGLGSGGRAMGPVGRDLARLGVAALTFDQRGHGNSTGVYVGDSSEDVLAAADVLAAQPEIDARRIAVMGHSSGAREAIIACLRSPRLAALVCTSSVPDAEGGTPAQATAFYRRIHGKQGDAVYEYPRDGALPWLDGRALRATSRAWSTLRGYRLRIRWQETLARWGRLRADVAIQEMEPRPLLIVHCRGDRAVPALVSEVLYWKASEPKELLLAPRGWHAAPLLPGPTRRTWTYWLATRLKAAGARLGVSA